MKGGRDRFGRVRYSRKNLPLLLRVSLTRRTAAHDTMVRVGGVITSHLTKGNPKTSKYLTSIPLKGHFSICFQCKGLARERDGSDRLICALCRRHCNQIYARAGFGRTRPTVLLRYHLHHSQTVLCWNRYCACACFKMDWLRSLLYITGRTDRIPDDVVLYR